MPTAFCSGCLRTQPVDRNWRALWIDGDGDLHITAPEHACDLDFERPNTVFACGEGSALALVERYLHSRSFQLAHYAEMELVSAAQLPNLNFDPDRLGDL
jgi:hypothetical protein